MNIRKQFVSIAMGIMILLPSATALVPVTYAGSGEGGGPDCSAEITAWMASYYALKAAREEAKAARAALLAAQATMKADELNYISIKSIPTVRPLIQNNQYYPYSTRADWVSARDSALATWQASILAARAAQVNVDNKSRAAAAAANAEQSAWNALKACINS